MERFDGLDILGPQGLRISNSDRKQKGVLRFNETSNKFEVFTGGTDTDGNEWQNLLPGVASDTNLGNVKVGNNLFMDTSTGKLNAISVGPSMFYQQIVTVAKNDIPFEQHITTGLPGGTVIKGGAGDFTTITAAISFIQTLDSNSYPRNKDNQWLVYVAPGTYKEDFGLLPFVSLKGYSKNATILEPTDDTNQHIEMTTNSSLMDVTIKYNNDLDNIDFRLIEVDSDHLNASVPSAHQIFNNTILIRDIDIDLKNINSVKVINLTKGILNFENCVVNVRQDEYNSAQDSDIYVFYLNGNTKLDIIGSRFNVTSNHQDVYSVYADTAKVTVLNSFFENRENINENVLGSSTNFLFKVYSSDVIVRNSQLVNDTLNGYGLDLLNSTDTSSITIPANNVQNLNLNNNILTLTVPNSTISESVRLKIDNKKALKINGNNYKVKHIIHNNNIFSIRLDTDRIYANQSFGSVEIKILNSVSLANTYLRANNRIVNSTSDNYLLETNNLTKEHSDYNITGNSLLELNHFNVIHIRKDKGDFSSISQALVSLGKLDTNLRYLIKVHTGVYNETNVIDLSGLDNVDLIGDSEENTVINLNFPTIPSGDNPVLIKGGNGIIKNIKFVFTNSLLMTNKLALLKFTSKDVKMNNVNFEVISNNINVIEMASCGTVNSLENIKINSKYYFLEDGGGATDNICGIRASASNLVKAKNVEIIISAHTSFEAGINNFNTGKTINNIHLSDTRIDSLNLNLDLTTDLASCNLILADENATNNFKNQIYGDSLILNTSEATNFILKHTTSGRFIIINTNILGDFSGSNIFTTGSVLLNPTNNDVHSYHTSLLSNNKDSVLIGNLAGDSTMGQTGSRNIMIGKESGKLITTGNDNVLMGNSSGEALVGHSRNILLGNSSGLNLTNDESVMVGFNSGFNTTNKNLFVGSYSGYNMTGINNIILGNSISSVTGYSNINKNNNIFIGNNSGVQSTGDNNVNIGEGSGRRDTGGNSVSVGNFTSSNSLTYTFSDITSTSTVGIVDSGGNKYVFNGDTTYNSNLRYVLSNGTYTFQNVPTAHPIAILNAGKTNLISYTGDADKKSSKAVTGTTNDGTYDFYHGNVTVTVNGDFSEISVYCFHHGYMGGQNLLVHDSFYPYRNTSLPSSDPNVGYNVSLGYLAGKNLTTGTRSIHIGAGAGENTDKDDNIFIGYAAGKDATGNENIFIGKSTGEDINGTKNVVIGKNCFIGNSSGTDTAENNLIIGNETGKHIVTNNNLILGIDSVSSNNNISSDNVVIGYQSGKNMGTSSGNGPTSSTFLGTAAGYNCQGDNNTYLGKDSGKENTTGHSNTYIGFSAGKSVTASNYSVLVGYNSGASSTNFDSDTFVGYNSGNSATGTKNTLLGFDTGNNVSNKNTFIGYTAGKSSTGESNVIIGSETGANVNSNYNIVIGASSMTQTLAATNDGNIVIGYDSGNKIEKSGNTYIGYQAGKDNEGQNNTIIGDSAMKGDKSTKENVIIGKNAGTNLQGDYNIVLGSSAGESNITNKIDSNLLIGYRAGRTNNKYNKLFVLGNNSGIAINENQTKYYDDVENTIIGNSSATVLNSKGNMLIGNNVGNSITGENNMMIGEKTGHRITTGNNNLFMGSGKSLIYKKLANGTVNYNDLSNTYRNSDNANPAWSLSNVMAPSVVVANHTQGKIEFILSEVPTADVNKVIGIKSYTTYKDFRFNPVGFNTIKYLIKIDGNDDNNQLKNKMFIRNFGGNTWGEYKDENERPLVPELSYTNSSPSFTYKSQLDRLDNLNNHYYRRGNLPIIYSPDDILEIKFRKVGVDEDITIIVRVHAIVQVIKNKDNTSDITDSSVTATQITLNNMLLAQDASPTPNPYQIMDERLYFDLLVDNTGSEKLDTSNFIVDDTVEMSITHISSAGYYNIIGNHNVFMGIESGNSSMGEDNLFLGYKAGKNSYSGSKNTVIGNNAGEILREGCNNTLIGKESGKYVNSVGNVIIGNETAKNAININSSIIIGDNAGTKISGPSNIIIGSYSGSQLTSNQNNILLGKESLYNSTSGNNNVIIGNNLDEADSDNSNVSDTLMLGNKTLTKVRKVENAIHENHLYIPVEDCTIFEYNELLKVYKPGDPTTFDYINTVVTTNYFLKPPKSIIHTFPKGVCEIVKEGTLVEFRDYSHQLLNLKFVNNSSTYPADVTNLGAGGYDYNRPLITIERIGITTNGDNNGIYEIFELPVVKNDGSYTYITLKKLNKGDNNFGVSEVTSENQTSLANVSVRINNNILILSNQSLNGNQYGRKDNGGNNIYKGSVSVSDVIDDGSIIEKIPNIIYTGSLNSVSSPTDTIFTHNGVEKIFKIGDIISRGINNNATNTAKTTMRIIDVTANSFKIESYTSDGTTVADLTNDGNSLRFIKETEVTNKPLIGNFNSNKVLVNAESSNITEKASMYVNGSVGLRDFLSLKICDGFPEKIDPDNEGIIWLQKTPSTTFTSTSIGSGSQRTISFASSHNLSTGDSLIYESGDISGFSAGSTETFVINYQSTSIQVAQSLSDALASTKIEISGTSAVLSLKSLFFNHTGSPNLLTRDTDGKINILRTSHTLNSGDAVRFKDRGGTAINELTDDVVYYVIKVDANNISLSDTPTGALSNIKLGISSTPASSIQFSLELEKSPQLKMRFKESSGVAVTKNILLY